MNVINFFPDTEEDEFLTEFEKLPERIVVKKCKETEPFAQYKGKVKFATEYTWHGPFKHLDEQKEIGNGIGFYESSSQFEVYNVVMKTGIKTYFLSKASISKDLFYHSESTLI